ncbi:Acyl-CoA synthetases (AMP-forming)/AMP-acid ligases II [Phaeobacter gallaeciensis]|uniref:AMP-binding protein n=1 Tax=Phaeobacter gallaeciensis TaxID=60890 RepID=A0A1B0ZN17_9RHOB|nr:MULTISPECIES: AMP-binding protein [Phaeobacter]MDF1773885.1 AMP-binding protein [Pseudophaeobacter sp. bin_em_oilr2.035]MEE2634777.1 AMP-binding protein [Pseudomonadota bacterium]ANP35559.1 Acyl-CoA synthetases (AMP-forming)/AMP-acid ligases II [Phaeobacter gallaeciensis]MDE4063721.1 AMP-binding protein [Phaeobacter gallaeciensis]MDE4126744.1 AMP-binding protein [Phaeobacter gallaeciensis]
MSFAREILTLANARPEAPALRFLERGERETYAASRGFLVQTAQKISEQLVANGLSGARVLLAFEAGPEFIETLLACLFAGTVVVPVPMPRHRGRTSRLDYIVADCDALAVLCRAADIETLAAHVGAGRGSYMPRILSYEDLCAGDAILDSKACPGVSGAAEDVVLIQYTSGSTRQPRGAMVTNRNLVENGRLVRRAWRLDTETMLNWMPHSHDMGLMGGILYPMLWGEMSIQMPPLSFVQRPARWLQAISDWRATMSGGPAFAFDLALKSTDVSRLSGLDLSCWRRAFCGAEPVPQKLLTRFRQRLAPAGLAPESVFACYGMAEATLFVAGAPDTQSGAEPVAEIPASQSPVAPCPANFGLRDRIRIVNPRTHELITEDGQSGEIWFSSASVARGYFARPVSQDTPFDAVTVPDDGRRYLRTGDLGCLENSQLYVSGRLKDTLIVNGENVAAPDVEWLAGEAHAGLNALAAAAFEGDQPGSAVLLVEVRDRLSDIGNIEELQRRIAMILRSEFGLDPVEVQILKRGLLERTTSGKIRRHAVRRSYLAGAFTPQGQNGARETTD